MAYFFNEKFRKKVRVISGILFITYLLILGYLLFFSSHYGRDMGISKYNIIPFKTISDFINYGTKQQIKINIVGNIIAFMPMGFFIPIIFSSKRSLFTVLVFSAFISLTVEIMQYEFVVGAFDIDDIILNSLGGVFGYIVFALIHLIYRIHRKRG